VLRCFAIIKIINFKKGGINEKIVVGFAFLMLILGNVVSEDTNSGIIYGENWAFMFSAPEGYVWDNVSLQHEGIWALFYKEEQDEFYGSKHHYILILFQKAMAIHRH